MPVIENDKYRFELSFGEFGAFQDKTTGEEVYKDWEDLKHPDAIVSIYDFMEGFLSLLHKVALSDWPEGFPKAVSKTLSPNGSDKEAVDKLIEYILESRKKQPA